MPLFWNSILIKSSFNWFKIKLCPMKLEKKKKFAWNSSSWSSSSIPIAMFWLSYSGILNGTRAPWTRVPCKFFFLFFLFEFDRAKPIAMFWLSYSGVLNGTRVYFYLFIFIYFKFNWAKPIATFLLSYSGVLNGTRAPWTRVPCNFFIIFIFIF